MTHSIKLAGTLIGGIVGPGGETTGYILQLPELDVDLSGLERPALVPGTSYLVFGSFEERTYPVRGRVQVLRAAGFVSSAAALTKQDLRASVFLFGALRTDVIRPGGESTGVTLVGARPEIDISELNPKPEPNQDLAVIGKFSLKDYVLRGPQIVFRAASFAPVKKPPVAALLTSERADALKTAKSTVFEGYSDKFSLEEAILDAVRQVPDSGTADALTTVRVEAIGAELGGIAGLTRLKVAVTANTN